MAGIKGMRWGVKKAAKYVIYHQPVKGIYYSVKVRPQKKFSRTLGRGRKAIRLKLSRMGG